MRVRRFALRHVVDPEDPLARSQILGAKEMSLVSMYP